MKHCLQCGMTISAPRCPKCDGLIAVQTDGSTVQFDIAHQGETVREALAKLERWLDQVRQELPRYVRVIVGTGRIREEALGWLQDAQFRGDVLSVETTANRGQILVQVKP
ncbi:MAG: hypothetical protein ACI9B8_000698 [Sulfitobacter sp.]|jgi:hypothetical protein